jgi:hypothetical protein
MDDKLAFLTIRNRAKSIPYPEANRPEGSRNHGYKRLKGRPDLVSDIPEADWESIATALARLNGWNSAFFSVGCEKAVNKHNGEFWVRGYLEFAFNYIEAASDAAHYFPLFFHFHRLLQSTRVSKCRFEFELEGAIFLDGPAEGYSVSVWIDTGIYKSELEAEQTWAQGLTLLADFLCAVPLRTSELQIYRPGKTFPT